MLQWLDFLMDHLELEDENLQLMRQCVYLACIQHGTERLTPFAPTPSQGMVRPASTPSLKAMADCLVLEWQS